MTPFTFTDSNTNTVAFVDGVISTIGPVALDPDAATALAGKLLQYSSQNRVGVRREYKPASAYRGLHGDC